MVGKRSSWGTSSPAPCPNIISANNNPISAWLKHQLANLSFGGTGGQIFSGNGLRKDAKSMNHSQWNLYNSTTHYPVPQHLSDITLNIPNSTNVPLNDVICPNIILPKQNLKEHIKGNLFCRKCIHWERTKQMMYFLAFLASELGLQPCQSDEIWLKYVRQSAKRNVPIFKKRRIRC